MPLLEDGQGGDGLVGELEFGIGHPILALHFSYIAAHLDIAAAGLLDHAILGGPIFSQVASGHPEREILPDGLPCLVLVIGLGGRERILRPIHRHLYGSHLLPGHLCAICSRGGHVLQLQRDRDAGLFGGLPALAGVDLGGAHGVGHRGDEALFGGSIVGISTCGSIIIRICRGVGGVVLALIFNYIVMQRCFFSCRFVPRLELHGTVGIDLIGRCLLRQA